MPPRLGSVHEAASWPCCCAKFSSHPIVRQWALKRPGSGTGQYSATHLSLCQNSPSSRQTFCLSIPGVSPSVMVMAPVPASSNEISFAMHTLSRTTPETVAIDAPENTFTSLPFGIASMESRSLRGGMRPMPEAARIQPRAAPTSAKRSETGVFNTPSVVSSRGASEESTPTSSCRPSEVVATSGAPSMAPAPRGACPQSRCAPSGQWV
mmetsp:Transcript_10068/g.24655  ORF Transcript_10068/g.24655 Transcript_10068/m.24655 type:complete len:209 (-) Transcript_10068:1134-1760(-)